MSIVVGDPAVVPRAARIPPPLRMLPFRGSDAVRAGLLTRKQLRSRAWRGLFHDVYIAAYIEMTHRRWCEAALIYAGSGAVVGGRSAAYLMGVNILPLSDDRVTVVLPLARSVRSHARLVVIRTDLDPSDVLRWRIPMTTPERTAFDLARLLDFENAVIAIDAMTNHKLVTLDAIRTYLLASRALRGRTRIPRVLAAAEPLAASPMETVLRLRIVDGGLPRPEAQVVVRNEYGKFVGRLDLGYRAYRVGLEYEGDQHRARGAFRRDITRGNALREAGWTVVRVTAADLKDPSTLLRQLRKLLNMPGSGETHRL